MQPLWRTPGPATSTCKAHKSHVRCGVVHMYCCTVAPKSSPLDIRPTRSVLQLPMVEFRALKSGDSATGVSAVRVLLSEFSFTRTVIPSTVT